MTGSHEPGLKKVLVIRIGRLGDTILATPVISVLFDYFGGHVSIDFVTSTGSSARILAMDQRVNRVFPVAHRKLHWRLHPEKRALERHSRKHPYDLVINLECGNECDDFIRFVHHTQFCGRPLAAPSHRADRHCVDTEKTIYADFLGPEVTVAAETRLQISLEATPLPVEHDHEFVILNPGFSGIGRAGYRGHRAWPLDHWLRLIHLIRENTSLAVLVNGTIEEQQLFSGLLQQDRVFSLFGSDLPVLMFALTKARALVSVDTGTMHLAAALGTPVVALFGPGNPRLTGPYGRQVSHRVLTSGVDCQPCAKTPIEKKCIFNRCMDELKAEVVFENLQQLTNT